MATITLTGTIKDLQENPVGNRYITITPLAVTGQLITAAYKKVGSSPVAETLGQFSTNLIKGAQYNIKGNVLRLTGEGLTVTMPDDADEVTLESLIASALVPATGLSIKRDNVAFASLVGTFNFSTDDFNLTNSPTGQLNISIAATSLVNPMSALGDSLYGGVSGAVTKLSGNITTTRKFLRQAGDGAASAAPAWDTLQASDIPSLSGTYSLTSHNHSGVYEAANANIQTHIASTSNPHNVTKSQVGLGSVNDVAQLPASYLDTDVSLTANSDTKVPSQKAVKAYVAANAGGGSGDVTGPSSSVDNAIARFDSTTGKLLQNSLASIDDNGRVITAGGMTGGVFLSTHGSGILDSNDDGRLDFFAGGSSRMDLVDVGGGNWRLRFGANGGIETGNGGLLYSGQPVVGARGAAVADATNSTDVITQLNALLSRLRAHGLIAA